MPAKKTSYLSRLKHWFNALFYQPKNVTELIELLRNLTQKKIIDADALGMIEGVLQVSEMQVRDIMIPRAQMIVIEHDAMPKEFLPIVIESQHSRFPVIGEGRHEVVGILLAKDLLNVDENNFKMEQFIRPAVFVPESKRLNILLREFRVTRTHMALVLDEYGSVAGLITIEDVLEQIVGEIEDESDVHEEQTNIKKMSNNQYNVKALTPIMDFNDYFGSNFSDEDFDTIGGLVLQKFAHLPKRGESISIKKFNFKVLHADNRRILLLRVSMPKKQSKTKT